MFNVGDRVIFTLDHAKGIVISMNHNLCHVLWEDYFVSWEKVDLLKAEDIQRDTNKGLFISE